MYKCDCGCEYEAPRVAVESHGFTSPPYEALTGCPGCGNGLIEGRQCLHCGGWYNEFDDYCAGWCFECAQHEYTDRLGLSFVANTDQVQCAVEYVYNISALENGRAVEVLLEDLKDRTQTRQGRDKRLARFCMDDMEMWIDFLNERDANGTL